MRPDDLLSRLRSIGLVNRRDADAVRLDAVRLDAAATPSGPATVEPVLAHLGEALTHPSFANEQRVGRRVDNQRLEFLGDAVLGFLVSELLMARMPAAKEGDLSLLRSQLVNTEALAAWARSIDLGASLRLGRGADAAGERERDTVLADAVEALVGAVHLDVGVDAARELVHAIVLEPLTQLEAGQRGGRDPKSELQELVQAQGGSSPRYRLVGAEGPDHRRAFLVAVEIDGEVAGEGRGRSKKLAEQAAARAAIDARAGANEGAAQVEQDAASSAAPQATGDDER